MKAYKIVYSCEDKIQFEKYKLAFKDAKKIYFEKKKYLSSHEDIKFFTENRGLKAEFAEMWSFTAIIDRSSWNVSISPIEID